MSQSPVKPSECGFTDSAQRKMPVLWAYCKETHGTCASSPKSISLLLCIFVVFKESTKVPEHEVLDKEMKVYTGL